MRKWKLMDKAISDDQREKLSNFVLTADKFSQGEEVKRFEEKWSKWQGCKYSVFVNSGSSANFLIVQAMKEIYPQTSTWVAQACTWATTVSPIIMSGDHLQLCDVALPNLFLDKQILRKIIKSDSNLKYLFLSHLLGFPAIDDEIIKICDENGIVILEDCCESHGATFNGKKVGNFGKASSFSFYYGHHMTTIEGGMVCTDDEEMYEKLLLLRSHGLLRELPPRLQEKYKNQVVDENFTFMLPGYNVRSTDFNAVLGQIQLESLDKHNRIRVENFNKFATTIDSDKYYANFKTEGNSSFCFPVITKKTKDTKLLREKLKSEGVETRPIIAGNLYRHPFMERVNQKRYDDNAEIVHKNGFYIGNNHQVQVEDVAWLTDLLNRS
jgi:CDP-6-deoxy-D-xylo-4-hexulose-3-dehydrase